MDTETKFAAITENDESQWDDNTGVAYHFPKRYLKYLQPGTNVVYYKGRIKNTAFRERRLSDDPHYFGIAKIGRIYPDSKSSKGDHFAEMQAYQSFVDAVPGRVNGEFIEIIPESRVSNYWRDGVRPITAEVYERICSIASTRMPIEDDATFTNDSKQGLPESLTSAVEGGARLRLVSDYERNPSLRAAAIEIHGTTCAACGFNFAEVYGPHGAGYIQVHHIRPLGDETGERVVDAKTDLIVLCANCHVMVHRFRHKSLSVDMLKKLLADNGT